jgi:hypothetical protein
MCKDGVKLDGCGWLLPRLEPRLHAQRLKPCRYASYLTLVATKVSIDEALL